MRQALSEAGQLLLLSPEHPAAGVVLPDDLPGRDLTGADGVKAGEGLAPVGQRRSHHQSHVVCPRLSQGLRRREVLNYGGQLSRDPRLSPHWRLTGGAHLHSEAVTSHQQRKRNFPRVAVSLEGNYQERTVITLCPPNHYVFTSSLPASRNTSMIIWN